MDIDEIKNAYGDDYVYFSSNGAFIIMTVIDNVEPFDKGFEIDDEYNATYVGHVNVIRIIDTDTGDDIYVVKAHENLFKNRTARFIRNPHTAYANGLKLMDICDDITQYDTLGRLSRVIKPVSDHYHYSKYVGGVLVFEGKVNISDHGITPIYPVYIYTDKTYVFNSRHSVDAYDNDGNQVEGTLFPDLMMLMVLS